MFLVKKHPRKSQASTPLLVSHLKLLERDALLPKVLGHEVAVRLRARRVVLHMQGDGTARLGAATHVVELKAHQRLDQRCATRGTEERMSCIR